MERKKVLVIEDNEIMRNELKRVFEIDKEFQFDVLQAANVIEYLDMQRKHNLDVLVVDMRLGNETGQIDSDTKGGLKILNIFQVFRSQNPLAIAIVFTAFPSLEDCVTAMRSGAWDYIDKNQPYALGKLLNSVKEGLAKRFSRTEGPDSNWLEEQFPILVKKFGGNWVAFINEEPVESDESLEELKRRIKEKTLTEVPYYLFIPKGVN